MGDSLGEALGLIDGLALGDREGDADGLLLGLALGDPDGLDDGLALGLVLGLTVGDHVGDSDGASVLHTPIVKSSVGSQAPKTFKHTRCPRQSSLSQHGIPVRQPMGHPPPPSTHVSNPSLMPLPQLTVDGL